VTILNIWHIKV